MSGMTVGILIFCAIVTTLGVSSLFRVFRGRNAQQAPTLVQNTPVAPAAGTPPPTAPAAGGSTTMSGAMKFWLGLVVIIVLSAGIVYAVSNGWVQWFIQWLQNTSGVKIFFALVVVPGVSVILLLGLREHWKSKESPGPKLFVTILACLLILFGAMYLVLGPDAVERGVQIPRQIGDNFANRVPSQNTTSSASARDMLCGPGKFVDGFVSSKTTPQRFMAELSCSSFVPQKSAGIPIRISYNGEAAVTWTSGNAPQYAGTVKHVDVWSPTGANVYVKFSFPF